VAARPQPDRPRAQARLRDLRRRVSVRRSVALTGRARGVVGALAGQGRRVPDEHEHSNGTGGRPVPDSARGRPATPRREPDLTRHVMNARLRKVGRDEDGRGRYTLEKAGPAD